MSRVPGVLADATVPGVDVTVKYTLFSTTFITAVWLLRVVIRGLESTLVLPKVSRSLIDDLIAPPTAALGLLY